MIEDDSSFVSNAKGSLSVAVPIYNVDEYLGCCLDSLCKALYAVENKEVICVNDGSTDNSLEVIKKYKKKYPFIKIIDQKNKGYGGAVNAALNRAKGEYVTIVESDDAILPGVYEKLLKKMDDNPEADLIKTPFIKWIDEKVSGTIRMTKVPDKALTIEEFTYPMIFPPSIWSSIYRRSFLDNNNIRVIETPGASYQDTYFSVLVHLLGGRMLYHDEPYYLYRSDRDESSVNSSTKTTEVFEIHHELINVLKEKGVFEGKIKALFYASAFRRTLWFFGRVATSFQDHALKLAYIQFTPVFEDSVLYSGVEIELFDHERSSLAQLKEGNLSSLNSFFGENSGSLELNEFNVLTKRQRLGVFVFGFIFRPFIEGPKMHKLKNQPIAFFRDSRSGFTRKIGSILNIHPLVQPNINDELAPIQKFGVSAFGLLFSPFMEHKKLIKLKAHPRAFFRDTNHLFSRIIGLSLGLIK